MTTPPDPTPTSDTRAPRAKSSTALQGREAVRLTRPAWGATTLPAHAAPLPIVTAAALTSPGTAAGTVRMTALDRTWNGPGWSPETAALRERGAAIRRETLADLEGHLARLTTAVEGHGGVVHRAATGADACAVIGGIVERAGARLVVKSKSMATEEIHLNHHLEGMGVEVVETDLGEYIVQLGDERPSHIIAPALHLSQEDIRQRFSEAGGQELPDELAAIAGFARERLREDFRRADVGISGVNFAAADTGTLTLMTNEGNGRMVTSQPRVHIAVMTVEKVIPRFTDLGVLLPLLVHAATKQRMSVYQTMINGPRRAGEPDGPEQLQLVIVDNGRSRLLGGRYEEVLACIRCGACQVACPVYRTVGGHAYAATYGGPIGAVLSPLLDERPEHAALPYLSSLCGKCADVCPVKIPLPDMLVDLRADHQAARGDATRQARGWRLWAALWTRPRSYRASVELAAAGRLLPDRVARLLPGARRWARGRELPPLRGAGAFRRWVARRAGRDGSGRDGAGR